MTDSATMYTVIINKPLNEAINNLIMAIADSGMLLLCHINGQANAAKIGETVPAVRILEVFRPELAVLVWRAHQPAGIDIPVRLYVYEDTSGNTSVNYRSLRQIMSRYNIPALTEVGEEADRIFAGIMQTVSGEIIKTN